MIYAGAGTSRRLAVQDGSELIPTFSWPPGRLLLFIAGGREALIRAVEGAEDGGGQWNHTVHGGLPAVCEGAWSSDDRDREQSRDTASRVGTGRKFGTLIFGTSYDARNPLPRASQRGYAGRCREVDGAADAIAAAILSGRVKARYSAANSGGRISTIDSFSSQTSIT